MMRVLLLLLVVLAGCKKASPPPDARDRDGGAIAVADGGSAETAEVDEAAFRAGKRTGLESPESTPEVATEELVRGLLRNQVLWSKVVDSSQGVIVLASESVDHICGNAIAAATAAFAASATATLDDPGLLYDITCDNTGLAVAVPGVTSHAVCSIASASGDGMELDLVFVPDPTLGMRLIGFSWTDALATTDEVRDRFDEALGRYGQRCPI